MDGTLVEQTEYIPVLGYATTPGMRAIAERFVGKVEPGDAILYNGLQQQATSSASTGW